MKRYSNARNQINKMKYRGLSVKNKPLARKVLQSYGYHEVVNAYQPLFKTSKNLTGFFDEGTDFSDIVAVFYMDMQIRTVLRKALEQFEMTFKQAVSEYFSKDIGEEQQNHLDRSNFVTGKMHNPRQGKPYSDLDYLQRKINHALSSKDSLSIHHRDKGNIPPWIVYKNMTMGTMKTYFMLLKSGELKNQITRRMLQSDFIESAGMENAKSYLIELIKFVHEFRNLASHTNRIFNYAPAGPNDGLKTVYKLFPHAYSKFERKEGYGRTGLYAIVKAFSVLENSDPFLTLDSYIQNDLFPALFEKNPDDLTGLQIAYGMRFPLWEIQIINQNQNVTPPSVAKRFY